MDKAVRFVPWRFRFRREPGIVTQDKVERARFVCQRQSQPGMSAATGQGQALSCLRTCRCQAVGEPRVDPALKPATPQVQRLAAWVRSDQAANRLACEPDDRLPLQADIKDGDVCQVRPQLTGIKVIAPGNIADAYRQVLPMPQQFRLSSTELPCFFTCHVFSHPD